MAIQPTEPATAAQVKLSHRASMAKDAPISELMHSALANPHLVSLAAGFVDQATLPADETLRAITKILEDPKKARHALQYGTTKGYLAFRETLLERLRKADDYPDSEAELDAERVVVTAGSNQFLHLITECLFDPGDIIICASPSYFVYLGLLETEEIETVGAPIDEHGIIPEELDNVFARLEERGALELVKALYLVSYFDNPCGVTLSEERRPKVVDIVKRWSRRHHIHIIDDIAYRELRYEGEDVPSMRAYDTEGDTVILAGTFSKSFSPGIRVGYGILPEHLVEPIANLKGNLDFGSPNLAQYVLNTVLTDGEYEHHVEMLRTAYSKKMHAMLDAAQEFLGDINGVTWLRPQGGLYVWLTLPEGLDSGPSGPLFDIAVKEGVLYVPGAFCYPGPKNKVPHNTIRLSFGVQSAEKIREGIEALARAVHRTLAT